MKIFRHFYHALLVSAIIGLSMVSTGCEYVNKVIAKDQLNQGAILYNQGNFRKAQEFFRSATETDPNNPWLEPPAVQILVVVANTPERPWRTDVEKGFV